MSDKNQSGIMKQVRQGLLLVVVLVAVFFVARALVKVRLLEERNASLEARLARLELLAALPADTLSAPYVPLTVRVEDSGSNAPRVRASSRPAVPQTAAAEVPYVAPLPKEPSDRPRQEKFQTPTRVELNTADTTTLMKIPGIGSKTAQQILAYRDALGGFYSPLQLGEKLTWDKAQEMLPEWTSQWMMADTGKIQRLNVNTLDFKTLLRHPYLGYDQVKALFNYRRKWGKITSISTLEQLESFTPSDIQRLSYYLEF